MKAISMSRDDTAHTRTIALLLENPDASSARVHVGPRHKTMRIRGGYPTAIDQPHVSSTQPTSGGSHTAGRVSWAI